MREREGEVEEKKKQRETGHVERYKTLVIYMSNDAATVYCTGLCVCF